MNPQELQNQQNTQEPLDSSVVALAKAIGKKESGGNYNAIKGNDGEIGAYQMTRPFIDQYAPKYLGKYNPENLSPEEQDKLAYNVIKEWGTTGKPGYKHLGKLNPIQVASAWNSGDPERYQGEWTGTSKGGAHYDTGEYVEEVRKNYEELQPYIPGENRTQSGMTEFDKNVTVPTAIGVGALAAGGAALAGGGALGEIGSIGSKLLEGIKGIPKAIIGNVVTEAVREQMPQSIQSVLPKAQQDFASAILGQAMPQESEHSNKLADALIQSLTRTPTGRVLAQDPGTRESISTGAKYGLAPEVDENGYLDFSNADKQRTDILSKLSNGVGEALKDEYTNFDDAVALAKKSVREHAPSNEWDEADKYIDNEAATYKKNFVNEEGKISNKDLQRMKFEMWHGQKFNVMDTQAKKIARKALGFGARGAIMQNTKHKDFYTSAMKEEQRLINFKKITKKMNGKRAPATAMGFWRSAKHLGAKYVSTYIGAKIGGPIGAILGDMVGEHLIGKIDKKYGKNIFESPQVQKAIKDIKSDHPEYYSKLVDELKKHGVEIKEEEKKLLSRKEQLEKAGLIKPKKRITREEKRKRLNKIRTGLIPSHLRKFARGINRNVLGLKKT